MKTVKKNTDRKNTPKNQHGSFFNKSGKNSFFQIQPKLKIGSSNDKFEQEAEKKSAQVANEKPTSKKETPSFSKPKIQAKPNSQKGISTPNNFKQQLQKTKGQGQSLPADSLKSMNQSFGQDFSNVKIHTGSASEKLNQSIQAKAFTHKNNIYFNKGNFSPNTPTGKKLLAHELTHVVQQQSSGSQIQRDPEAEAKKKAEEAIAKEKATIVSTYKLKGIVNGDKSWTLNEVKQLKSALALLPEGDKKMIEQVEFKRVESLPGSTVGQFEPSQGVAGTTVTYDKTIQLENDAFGNSSTESNLIIVHEVGHAVASFQRREAVFEHHTAIAENNKLIAEAQTIVDDKKPFYDDFEKSRLAYNALNDKRNASKDRTERAELKKQMDKDLPIVMKKKAVWEAKEKLLTKKKSEIETAKQTVTDKKDLAEKTKISTADLKKVKDKVGTSKSAQATSLAAANKSMNEKSEEFKTEASAYISSVEALNVGIENLSTQTNDQSMSEKDVETLIANVEILKDNRKNEKENLETTNKDNPALNIYNSVESKQDDWYKAVKAQSLAHERSARVQKFVDFVEANNIDPITAYAMENWPHKPEEFYAEAYAWFFVKPKELETKSKDLHDWFKNGNYKK